MALIGRCESGFLVDHKKTITESVSPLLLTCKETLFALYEPYFRSSTENSCEPNGTRKRKRKKSSQVFPTEEESEAAFQHHKEIQFNLLLDKLNSLEVRDTIATGVERLVQIGVDKNYFLSGSEHVQQNTAVSAVPEDSKDFAGLLADVSTYTRSEARHLTEPLVLKGENITASETDILDRMISYPCNNPAVLNISGDKYILPPNCNFLMSNASNLKPLINHAQHNGLYNVLVLDPPWFNKSAKRGSKYSFMSLWQIKSLPVPHLLAPGALVGIWVTNKQKYLRFARTELFPHWSVELVAEWYWVKVTRKGELVTELDSPHKKPYEPLLLGRFTANKDSPGTFCLSVTKGNESAKERMKFSTHENKSRVLSPRPKRKKINECDEDDEKINTTCYISNKNVASTMLQERTALSSFKPRTGFNCTAYSDHTYEYLDNFVQTVPSQSPRNDFLSCCKQFHKNKDDVESLSDVMQKECDKQGMELNESECPCVNTVDLNIVEDIQETNFIMNFSSKHSELLRRDTRTKDCQLLPYQQIICSVPCKIHSRKPPLSEILSQYVPHGSLCLEMFARNLTPHWSSWGNEVLRFQGMQYFDQLPLKQETNENAT